jgi:hypothetical protein
VALFSATDGSGAARFGITGGNIISGSGVATGDAVRQDFWRAVGRFKQFKDTRGQPYYQGPEMGRGFAVMYSPENEEVFLEAFKQMLTGLIIKAAAGGHVAAGTAIAAAGVDNTIMAAGTPVRLWSNPRLTGNDWYVSAAGAKHKGIFEQRRLSVTGTYANSSNSDHTRNFDEEYVQWKARHGVGALLPLGLIKVDN